MAIQKNSKIDVAVIGAGAIGGLVAGYLKLKDENVFLVATPESAGQIKESGLAITGARGDFSIKIDVSDRLGHKPDLVILATKTQDLERALRENLKFIKDSALLTVQNGVRADNFAAQYIPKENIISSIVMFAATYLTPEAIPCSLGQQPARIIHNFEGSWIIGKIFDKNDERVIEISGLLNEIFPTIVAEDLLGMKYLKIFVNANNCIPAILGLSMQEAFSDIAICRISAGIWKEGLSVLKRSGINLTSLPDFSLDRLNKICSLPALGAAKIFSSIMANLSKEPLYGSILQSIKRGRPSEIDYINGEFINLAKKNNLKAALNEKLVELVHRVEATHKFFSKSELLKYTEGLCD